MLQWNILQYLTKILRQYFNCNERLEKFLTCFCNILCYVWISLNKIDKAVPAETKEPDNSAFTQLFHRCWNRYRDNRWGMMNIHSPYICIRLSDDAWLSPYRFESHILAVLLLLLLLVHSEISSERDLVQRSETKALHRVHRWPWRPCKALSKAVSNVLFFLFIFFYFPSLPQSSFPTSSTSSSSSSSFFPSSSSRSSMPRFCLSHFTCHKPLTVVLFFF